MHATFHHASSLPPQQSFVAKRILSIMAADWVQIQSDMAYVRTSCRNRDVSSDVLNEAVNRLVGSEMVPTNVKEMLKELCSISEDAQGAQAIMLIQDSRSIEDIQGSIAWATQTLKDSVHCPRKIIEEQLEKDTKLLEYRMMTNKSQQTLIEKNALLLDRLAVELSNESDFVEWAMRFKTMFRRM